MKQLPSWLKLISGKLDADGDSDVVMMLQEPIGEENGGVNAEDFISAAGTVPKAKKLSLHIHCLGGSVPEGMRIHNFLAERGNVVTRVVGYAASMGAVIHQAGAVRQMMPGTMIVIHDPQGAAKGEADDLESGANMLRSVKNSIVDLLAKRTGNKADAVSDMMKKTTAMSPAEAKKMGFCDEVIDGTPAWNEMKPADLFNFLRDIKNGGPGSGRHAEGGDHELNETRSDAAHATEQAKRQSYNARKNPSSSTHTAAAEAHGAAADAHERSAGLTPTADTESVAYHDNQAAVHRMNEKYHSSQAANNRAVNNHLGGQPAAVNQPNKKSMKLILTALAGLLTLPADATDEAAAPQVKNAVDSLVKERDQLKASVESFTTAMKTRVTNRVDAAIAAKKVKPERKDALIALGLTNETNLDFLDDLAQPTTGQPPRRGAAPLPNDQPTDLDAINAKIKELRNSLDDASPAEQSKIAKQLRELRGHKELFATAAK